MKLPAILASMLIAVHAFSQQGKPEPRTPAAEAGKKIGQTVVVMGQVVQVTKRDKVVYLNFEKKFPNSVFTAVILGTAIKDFPDIEKIEGKKVEVDGKVEEYRGKPQIVIKGKSQLRVLDK